MIREKMIHAETTRGMPVEVLEARAADQRRQLHHDVHELRSAIREQLDVPKRLGPRVLPLSGAAAVLGLLVGYGLTSLLTD